MTSGQSIYAIWSKCLTPILLGLFVAVSTTALAGPLFSPQEMAAMNRNINSKVEREEKEVATFKQKWDEGAAQRETRTKEYEAREKLKAEAEARYEASISDATWEDAFRNTVLGRLKDPESARFKDIAITKDGEVCGFVNAKNSYGGYTGFQVMCYKKAYLKKHL